MAQAYKQGSSADDIRTDNNNKSTDAIKFSLFSIKGHVN